MGIYLNSLNLAQLLKSLKKTNKSPFLVKL
jgi:hypothetical protein